MAYVPHSHYKYSNVLHRNTKYSKRPHKNIKYGNLVHSNTKYSKPPS